jgi:hypothetical protein
MSDNNRSDDRSEELDRINAQLDAQRKEIEALREDAKSEARKWSDFLAQNMVLMNAGAAVAVLAFLGTAEPSRYGWAPWSLVAFALGAFLPQLTALGNLYGAQFNDEWLQGLGVHALAFAMGKSAPQTRTKSDFHKTWRGWLSRHAGAMLYAAMAAFWFGVLLGMRSLLWAQRAEASISPALSTLSGNAPPPSNGC